MALAVLTAGALRAALPPELREGEERWVFLVVVAALLGVLIVGDPGRIDRQSRPLRVVTGTLIGLIAAANAAAGVRLVAAIMSVAPFTADPDLLLASGGAIWLTNVLCLALWSWDLDRGGAAARARGAGATPAYVFPEMTNSVFVRPDWRPAFLD